MDCVSSVLHKLAVLKIKIILTIIFSRPRRWTVRLSFFVWKKHFWSFTAAKSCNVHLNHFDSQTSLIDWPVCMWGALCYYVFTLLDIYESSLKPKHKALHLTRLTLCGHTNGHNSRYVNYIYYPEAVLQSNKLKKQKQNMIYQFFCFFATRVSS